MTTTDATGTAPPPGPAADSTAALLRVQGVFHQPEPPKAATWHLNQMAERMPYDIAREMPHGSALVLPDKQLKILLAVPELIALGRMGLLLGPSGSGKSVLLGCARAACPHRVAHVDLKSKKTEIGLARAVYKAITGVECTIAMNRGPDPVWRAIEVELAHTPTLLVVDEVHLVPINAVMALHDLAKRTVGRFGVLVAGTDKAKKRLKNDETCWRRFYFREELRKIPDSQLVKRLDDWHPLFRGAAQPENKATAALVRRINKTMCNGSWGQWANFVEAHQGQVGRETALTEATARRALSRYNLALPD